MMTTPGSGTRSQTSACNGVTAAFGVSFKFVSNSDLRVYLHSSAAFSPDTSTLLTEGVDYTVSGSGEELSAVVTTAVAHPAGKWITRYRVTSMAQTADYVPNDGFPAASHERQLDRLSLVDEELAGDLAKLSGQALRVPGAETIAPLPAAASRGDRLLGFFAGGAARLFSASALASFIVTPLLSLLPDSFKGDPGGNIMAIGLFTAAGTLTIPAGTDTVRTSGHSAKGAGSAFYIADSNVDAAFVAANPRWAFVSANGRGFRLAHDQLITVQMFGTAHDGVTNDKPAFDAATAFLVTRKVAAIGGNGADFPVYGQLLRLWIPLARYYLAEAWELKAAAYVIESDYATLMFPANTSGIIVHRPDTSGETTAAETTGADGTAIRRLILRGGSGTQAKHGLWLRAVAKIEHVTVTNFPGNGFNVVAAIGASGAARGAANVWQLDSCIAIRNGDHGFYFSGDDANAGTSDGCSAITNGGFGFYDHSFLGNNHIGFHTEENGTVGSGCSGAGYIGRPSVVHQGGTHYACVIGQEAAASTTTPGTNLAVWRPQGSGGVTSTVPQWVNGAAYRAGGSYACDLPNNYSAFVGPYQEDGQGRAQILKPSVIVGGISSLLGNSTAERLGTPSGSSVNTLLLGGVPIRGAVFAASDINGTTVSLGDRWLFATPAAGGAAGIVVTTGGVAGSTAVIKTYGAVAA